MKILPSVETRMKTILFLFFTLILGLNVDAQVTKKHVIDPIKNPRLDRSKPAVYLRFEKLGAGEPLRSSDSKERVWLNLVNNSRWSIFISTFVDAKGKPLGVYHKVDRYKVDYVAEMPKGYLAIDVGSYPFEIKPGKTFRFSVPRNHLSENLKIIVNFKFEWDNEQYNSVYWDPTHSVEFYSFQVKY